MKRRSLLKALAATSAAGFTAATRALAAIPKMKITRIRAYLPPQPNPIFNQSNIVVSIETDAGLTGIGEGGPPDTLEPSPGILITPHPPPSRHLLPSTT